MYTEPCVLCIFIVSIANAILSGISAERITCEVAWEEYESKHEDRKYLPAWGIGVVPVMAVLMGYLIFMFFEEPLRKYFRKKK